MERSKFEFGRSSMRFLLALIVVITFDAASVMAALAPDEIVLITNSKVKASGDLASLYARTRKIPDGHMLALDLPFPDEDMSAEVYEQQVVPNVRDFLEK